MLKMCLLNMIRNMSKLSVLIPVVFLLLAGCTESSSSTSLKDKKKDSKEHEKDLKNGEKLTVDEVKAKIDSSENFYLVDIRPKEMYERAHIAGAVSLPFNEMLAGRLEPISRDKQVVLYCQTGKTTEAVMEFLSYMGFSDVKMIEGGILQWKYGLVINDSLGQWI